MNFPTQKVMTMTMTMTQGDFQKSCYCMTFSLLSKSSSRLDYDCSLDYLDYPMTVQFKLYDFYSVIIIYYCITVYWQYRVLYTVHCTCGTVLQYYLFQISKLYPYIKNAVKISKLYPYIKKTLFNRHFFVGSQTFIRVCSSQENFFEILKYHGIKNSLFYGVMFSNF